MTAAVRQWFMICTSWINWMSLRYCLCCKDSSASGPNWPSALLQKSQKRQKRQKKKKARKHSFSHSCFNWTPPSLRINSYFIFPLELSGLLQYVAHSCQLYLRVIRLYSELRNSAIISAYSSKTNQPKADKTKNEALSLHSRDFADIPPPLVAYLYLADI